MGPLLHKFQGYLSKGAFSTELQEVRGFPQLIIHFQPDTKKRKRQLFLSVHEQALFDQRTVPSKILRLSLDYTFPFYGKTETHADVSSLLHFLNQQCDLPGFILDESSDQILYRTTWFSAEEGVTPPVLQGVIGFILLMIDAFQDKIEAISSGTLTFDQFLEEVIEEAGP